MNKLSTKLLDDAAGNTRTRAIAPSLERSRLRAYIV